MPEDITTYATLPPESYMPRPGKEWQGIWCGDYSGHGCEFLLITQPDDEDARPLPEGMDWLRGWFGEAAENGRQRRESGGSDSEGSWVSARESPSQEDGDGASHSSRPTGRGLWNEDPRDVATRQIAELAHRAEAEATAEERAAALLFAQGLLQTHDVLDGFTEGEASPSASSSSSAQAIPSSSRDVEARPDEFTDHKDAPSGRLEAIKLTGDPNIPRCEYTFIAPDIGHKGFVRVCDEQLFKGARVVRSAGHIAGRGFISDGIALFCTLHPASSEKAERCINLLRTSAREYYRTPRAKCTAWSYFIPLQPNRANSIANPPVICGLEIYTTKAALQSQVDDPVYFQRYHEIVKQEDLYAKPEELVAWYPAGGFQARDSSVDGEEDRVLVSVTRMTAKRSFDDLIGILRPFVDWVTKSEPDVLTYAIFGRPKAPRELLLVVRYKDRKALKGHLEAPEHTDVVEKLTGIVLAFVMIAKNPQEVEETYYEEYDSNIRSHHFRTYIQRFVQKPNGMSLTQVLAIACGFMWIMNLWNMVLIKIVPSFDMSVLATSESMIGKENLSRSKTLDLTAPSSDNLRQRRKIEEV
ncbi:hypothetical protein D0869_15423 [Hortaea werneckii]|uniref:ABM domain-containing protein n=1 Tax=Hortaea werneckii TaxID=91943 RepID=A0A3M6VZW9_HORWE|nr:hypothetical protein D0869_15423 [Hortaea werneckii]